MTHATIPPAGILAALLLSACASTPPAPSPTSACGGYGAPGSSPYILPFPKGTSSKVVQGNCSETKAPWTHFGVQKYAYDFAMPIGTPVLAARAGTVLFVRDSFGDDQHGKDQGNALVLLQEDGTFALYGHITRGGSKVKLGNVVKQGDTIALSGNSGQSPLPHLHFQVDSCGDFTHCPSLAVAFRNASPEGSVLLRDSTYRAR